MIFAEKVIGLGVEFAAGAVFLTIIKLKLWGRRDGLSLSFFAGEPLACRMGPLWACVVCLQLAFRS